MYSHVDRGSVHTRDKLFGEDHYRYRVQKKRIPVSIRCQENRTVVPGNNRATRMARESRGKEKRAATI